LIIKNLNMNGITVKVDNKAYNLGLLDQNGHVSVIILMEKKGRKYDYTVNISGFDGDIQKKWVQKILKLESKIDISYTLIDEITTPKKVGELEKTHDNDLLMQFYDLQDQLIKEGLI